jgi:hypothetical protein
MSLPVENLEFILNENCGTFILTKDATNKSAIANDAKNKFPIRRKLLSV